MKMNYEHQAVTKSSNNLETSQAQIMMTPEMLELLSSGVYQFKERAVIRELSCNALDGQVLKGNPEKPFLVHLPTDFEPYFEIRDYGVGLGHDDVMNLYMNYGASTKNNSDEMIGAMGIGSKSPFAISDSFTVKSFFDGVVTTYQVYKEAGIPQITKLMQKPFEEGETTGLSIRVPVKSDYIGAFYSEAHYVYETFEVKPICNRQMCYVNNKHTLANMDGEYTAFSQVTTDMSNGGLFIIMGSIRYPIKVEDCLSRDDRELLAHPALEAIKELWVYVPIGTVSISASRESLQLNERTKAVVKDAYTKIATKFVKDIQDKVDSFDNIYQVGDWWRDYTMGMSARSVSALSKVLTFEGTSFLDWNSFFQEIRYRDVLDDKGNKVPQTKADGTVKVDVKGNTLYVKERVPLYYYLTSTLMDKNRKVGFSLDSLPKEYSPFYGYGSSGCWWSSAIFFVYDRVTKGGAPKTAGKAAVLTEMAEHFAIEKGTSVPRYMIPVESRAEAEYYWNRFLVPDEYRVLELASKYDYAYVPQKREKALVKVHRYHVSDIEWERVRKGDVNLPEQEYDVSHSEGQLDLGALLEDGKQHIYLKCQGGLIEDGVLRGSHYTDVAQALACLIDGSVVVFNKANWKKIPDEWEDGSSESTLRKLITGNPEVIKVFNMHSIDALRYSLRNNTRLSLTEMGIKAEGSSHRFYRDDVGKVITEEEAKKIFKLIFKRPTYVVRYTSSYNFSKKDPVTTLLHHMVACKLRKKLHGWQKRTKKKFENIRKEPFNSGLEVLKFVPMDRVRLTDLADSLGILWDKSAVIPFDADSFYTY